MLTLITAAASLCEPFCSEPCGELNGDVAGECGDCVLSVYLCRPGQPGFGALYDVEVTASGATEYATTAADGSCRDLAPADECQRRADDCGNSPTMWRQCPSTCNRCEMAPPTQQQPIDSKASLTDARFPSERFLSDSPSTQCSASARLTDASHSRRACSFNSFVTL